METRPLHQSEDRPEDPPNPGTPEDVAILYSWANIEGAKYRDFSANRREHRAQMRHRAAEQLRMMQLQAQSEAEAAAAQAEFEAEQAHREADAATAKLAAGRKLSSAADPASEEAVEMRRRTSLREAAQQARKAAAERLEASRRAEAAALADSIARREEREIAEAQASAMRQAAQYAEAEARGRQKKSAGAGPAVPGRISDPYGSQELPEGAYFEQPGTPVSELEASRFRRQREYIETATGAEVPEFRMPRAAAAPSDGSLLSHAPETMPLGDSPRPAAEVVNRIPESGPAWLYPREQAESRTIRPAVDRTAGVAADFLAAGPPIDDRTGGESMPRGAAGRFRPNPAEPIRRPVAATGDVTPHPGEAGAPRWFALKSVFAGAGNGVDARAGAHNGSAGAVESGNAATVRTTDLAAGHAAGHGGGRTPPILAVFSLAGGVGKTTLVATVGRALSSLGEKVLLTDTTSHGLLPLYFGARDLRPGVVRTFSPPVGHTDAPIHLVSYSGGRGPDRRLDRRMDRRLDRGLDRSLDMNGSRNGVHQTSRDRVQRAIENGSEDDPRASLVEDLLANSQRASRVLLDLDPECGWLVGRLARSRPTILVPLAPDMNSVVSLQAVEGRFGGMKDAEGHALRPFYLLNQFDPLLRLHRDVRELLGQQLGDRLLPFVVRRASAVGEALAEGMTIVDYAPESDAARDCFAVPNWVRTLASAVPGVRGTRWSERWNEAWSER